MGSNLEGKGKDAMEGMTSSSYLFFFPAASVAHRRSGSRDQTCAAEILIMVQQK